MTTPALFRLALSLLITYAGTLLGYGILTVLFFSFDTVDLTAEAITYKTNYEALYKTVPTILATLALAYALGTRRPFSYWLTLSATCLVAIVSVAGLVLFPPQLLLYDFATTISTFDRLTIGYLLPSLTNALLGTLAIATTIILCIPRVRVYATSPLTAGGTQAS